MKLMAIISRAESLQILKNNLRKAALEKRAAELKDASAEQREMILAEVECEIQKEVRQYARIGSPGKVIY